MENNEKNSDSFNLVVGGIVIFAWGAVISAIPLLILPALIIGGIVLLLGGALHSYAKIADTISEWVKEEDTRHGEDK